MAASRNQLIIGGALVCSVLFVGLYIGGSMWLRDARFNSVKEKVEASMQQVSAPQRQALADGRDFKPFGIGSPQSEKMLTLATDSSALADYFQIEAKAVEEERYQMRAWPRGDSIRGRKVSPQMFYIEFDGEGKVLARGWAP